MEPDGTACGEIALDFHLLGADGLLARHANPAGPAYLPSSSSASRVSPVVLPPGWARFVINPSWIGSGSVDITIATVRVACCAARTPWGALATITSTGSRTSSVAKLR